MKNFRSAAFSAMLLMAAPALADQTVLAPAPALDAKPAPNADDAVAVFSGGCFWGMQDVFQHVKGVRLALSGYTGGTADTAQYETVSTGATGHAESLKIIYDPKQVSYGTLLRIYVSVAADPTELNYQGPDSGTQYRSEIWAQNAEQRQVATAYLHQLTASHVFSAPIVVGVQPAMPFYPAEAYHQNYAALHPDSLYIAYNDAPKITALRQLFPQYYQAQPVLVASPAG